MVYCFYLLVGITVFHFTIKEMYNNSISVIPVEYMRFSHKFYMLKTYL